MKLKHNLTQRIRGWLPKESNLPSRQRSTSKTLKMGTQIAIVALIMGWIGGLLGAVGYFLGFSSGFSLYSWSIVMGMCLGIIAATILIRKKQKEGQQKS